MLYIVETKKDVETAARDLEEAVKRNKFGVLHVHDLQKTLKEKGVDLTNACKILEVCNPQRATQVLTGKMMPGRGMMGWGGFGGMGFVGSRLRGGLYPLCSPSVFVPPDTT